MSVIGPAAVTSLSWIPSELLHGVARMPFDLGLTHYDDPPPDRLDDIEGLRRAGRFRFVNRLRAEAEVAAGSIVSVRTLPDSGGVMGLSNLLGGAVHFPAIRMPDLVTSKIGEDGATALVRQTAGGRAALPAPRIVAGRPRLVAPLVWTTLELLLRVDGTFQHRVVGASAFPRHWIYDAQGKVVEKVALTNADAWFRMDPARNPWQGAEEEVLTSGAETELERRISRDVMHLKRRIQRLRPGDVLFRQGDSGSQVILLLDGVVEVVRNDIRLAEIGPGAVLGERSLLEGARTATVRAVTDLTVAAVDGNELSRRDLELLVDGHRREDHTGTVS